MCLFTRGAILLKFESAPLSEDEDDFKHMNNVAFILLCIALMRSHLEFPRRKYLIEEVEKYLLSQLH